MKEDPADDALSALQRERWNDPRHEAELLARLEGLEHSGPPPRRWPQLLCAAVLGGVATAATVTAADGWRWLAELFTVEIVDVERDGSGGVERMVIDDGQRRLMLQAIDAPLEQVVEVERVGGGTLRLRVLREGDLGLVPAFAAVGEAEGPPTPGQRLVLRRITPEAFRGEVQKEGLVLSALDGGVVSRTVVLPPVPGAERRYSDGSALVEVLD
jgi:hypothetical protein